MTEPPARRIRLRVRVEGVVQGVGFRPFVYALATRLGLAGVVGNDAHGVFAEVEGEPSAVSRFVSAVRTEAPPLAVVEQVHTEPAEPTGAAGFVIVESRHDGLRHTLVSPDTATCPDCLRELFDPADRRFGYPFVNCTNCGPRFTIIRDVPYDRELTTMAPFAMCADCAREYQDPADRRFHAQPVCCPACGPRLRLVDGAGHPVDGDPLTRTAELLAAGSIVAIKGLGGYHLAVAALDEPAVARLRSRKHREDKPFAVMVADLAAARSLCLVGAVAASLLTSYRRPVVVLPRRAECPVAPSAAPRNRSLGLLLPYTPLHHLLCRQLGDPFVLTSGNVSEEPIVHRDADLDRLRGIADFVLTHDRAIHIRTDDSVARVVLGRELVLRRSRGYAPQPLVLPWRLRRPVLACGAELKNTFCLGDGRHAFLSHHIGDLTNYQTLRSFTEGIAHFRRIFDITPELVAHDLHPDYLSTRHALDCPGVELVGVQHHHAHIASCLADNAEPGPVLGIAFDGTGYGTDQTIWGGEFLVADLVDFERVGCLVPVAMPGGAAAIREPWRMAAAYLDAAGPDAAPPDLPVLRRHQARWWQVVELARSGVNTPLTSSAGRLFDAVAAVLGLRDEIHYEGQAAIELEQLAEPRSTEGYPCTVAGTDLVQLRGADLVAAAAADLLAGRDPGVISARFHHGLAAACVNVCVRLGGQRGIATVALSGGVFQNVLFTTAVTRGLQRAGFRVLRHLQVPPNDGGISFGQLAVAGARDRADR